MRTARSTLAFASLLALCASGADRDVRDIRDVRDARSSGGAAGPRPLLELLSTVPDAATATGSLPGVTLTRASPRYCTRADGLLVLLDDDEPCVESQGLSVQQQHTNKILRSQDLEVTPWAPQGGGFPAVPGPILTADACTAPDGTATADKLDVPAVEGGGAPVSIHHTGNYASGSTTNVVSLWAKGTGSTPTGSTYLSVYDTQWNTRAVAFTSTWQRFSLVRAASGVNFDLLLGTDLRDVQQSGTPALSFCVWQAQDTESSYPLSDTRTGDAGASTVDLEVASMSGAALPTASGRIEVDVVTLWSAGTHVLFDTRTGDAGEGIAVFVVDGVMTLKVGVAAGTAIESSALTWTPGTKYRVVARWGAGNLYLERDGEVVASNVTGGADQPSAHGDVKLGLSFAGTAPLDGWLSRLLAYP